MATKKTQAVWPKVQKGSHLTVYTYEDGSSKLEWDDDQLLKEVREAIASVKAPKKAKPVAKEPVKKAPAKKAVAKKAPAKKTVVKKKTK